MPFRNILSSMVSSPVNLSPFLSSFKTFIRFDGSCSSVDCLSGDLK